MFFHLLDSGLFSENGLEIEQIIGGTDLSTKKKFKTVPFERIKTRPYMASD